MTRDKVERALVAWALLGEKIESADLYEGLWDFLRPITAERAGQRFVPSEATEWLQHRYSLHMPVIVMENLAARLVSAGILVANAAAAGGATYVYATSKDGAVATTGDQVHTQIVAILERFASFVGVRVAIDREALDAAFFDRLLRVESLSILSRRDGQIAPRATPNTISLRTAETAPRAGDADHLDYLFSSFLLWLQEQQPGEFELAAQIAGANLVSEALLTYREPPRRGEALDAVDLYIDGPLCLDILGVNMGREPFGAEFLQLLKSSGAHLRVFHHTILEIERVLDARKASYLGAPLYASERTVEPPAVRDRVRALAGHAEQILVEHYGLTVVDGASAVPVGMRSRIGAGEEQTLRQSLRNSNHDALETDVRTACEIMRLRAVREISARISDAGPIVITRNGLLQSAANNTWRSYLVDSKRASSDRAKRSAPVAVSERNICGVAWIVAGGSLGNLSRARLVANCAAATATRKDVIAQVLNTLQRISPQDEPIFRAVIADQRAERALMNVTMGDPHVVSDEGVLALLSTIKEATAAEIIERKDAEIKNIKQGYTNELGAAAAEVERVQQRLREAESKLATAHLQWEFAEKTERDQRRASIQRLFGQARLVHRALTLVGAGVLALVTYAAQVSFPAWAQSADPSRWAWLKHPAVAAIVFVLAALLLAWDIPDAMLGHWRDRFANVYLRWRATRLGLTAELALATCDFKRGQLEFENSASS